MIFFFILFLQYFVIQNINMEKNIHSISNHIKYNYEISIFSFTVHPPNRKIILWHSFATPSITIPLLYNPTFTSLTCLETPLTHYLKLNPYHPTLSSMSLYFQTGTLGTRHHLLWIWKSRYRKVCMVWFKITDCSFKFR